MTKTKSKNEKRTGTGDTNRIVVPEMPGAKSGALDPEIKTPTLTGKPGTYDDIRTISEENPHGTPDFTGEPGCGGSLEGYTTPVIDPNITRCGPPVTGSVLVDHGNLADLEPLPELDLSPLPTPDVDPSDLIEMLGERLLVLKKNPEEVSAGGILIPEKAQTPPTIGEIKVAGDKCDIATGEWILFPDWAAQTELQLGNTTYVVINEPDVYATIQDPSVTAAVVASED